MIDTNKSMPFTNYSMQANNPDIQLERDHEKCLNFYSRQSTLTVYFKKLNFSKTVK